MANVNIRLRSLRRGSQKPVIGDWDEVFTVINALVTAVNELRTDHATAKTLQDELIVDHATSVTLQDELVADHAILVTLLTEIIAAVAGVNAKLDADAGVTDTDFAATWDIAAANIATLTAVAQATLSAAAQATLAAAAVDTLVAE